jgi:hypothetical protein
MLIVRDGRLVAEGYARDVDDRLRIAHVQSITRSVTWLVFLALERMGALLAAATPPFLTCYVMLLGGTAPWGSRSCSSC